MRPGEGRQIRTKRMSFESDIEEEKDKEGKQRWRIVKTWKKNRAGRGQKGDIAKQREEYGMGYRKMQNTGMEDEDQEQISVEDENLGGILSQAMQKRRERKYG